MSHPNKAKGTRFETDVVRFLRDFGFQHAERRALAGSRDCGDVTGIPGVVIECKDEKRIDLSGYADEVSVETENASAFVGAAVVKRRRRATEQAYVVLDLRSFASLLQMALD